RVVPKVAYAYSTGDDDAAGEPFMFLAPLGPDGADRVRAIAAEVMGPRHADYVAARARIGVHREAVFLESTPIGDAAVLFWRADDPQASLRALAASDDPFDQWLRDQAASAHPIDLAMIADIASRNE